jgi:hypothetical protein
MTTIELMSDLERRGVKLEARGERLRYHPASAVTPELLKALSAHKVKILSILKKGEVEQFHYAIQEKAIYGVLHIEECLVGCGVPVRFYYQDGIGYGYCARCDVHQRIVPQPM